MEIILELTNLGILGTLGTLGNSFGFAHSKWPNLIRILARILPSNF
jgi:hypothetical protein